MICPNCFNKTSENTNICMNCGFDIESYRQPDASLPTNTILNAKYLIGRVLGQGGFGITYKVKNLDDNRIYCIKEYLPSEFSVRGEDGAYVRANSSQNQKIFQHGKNRFLEEARILYRFRNNPIVTQVYDYFEENNTAYFVMEFLDGMNLKQAIHNMGGKISIENANTIFVTIASGLIEIHKQNVLHRDISPENIFLTKDYNIKLIDFGAARNYIKSQNCGMSVLLKPGFAPPEQYKAKGEQGEWTDVYALAVTYYAIVSGEKPVDAMSRLAGDKMPLLSDICPEVPVNNAKVLEKAYDLNIKNRYRNFEELLNDFEIPYVQENQVHTQQEVSEGNKNTTETSTEKSKSSGEMFVDTSKEKVKEQTTTSRTVPSNNVVNTSMRKGVFRKIFGRKKPLVIIRTYSNKETIFPISEDTFTTIGRSKHCNIVINDDQISRLHCFIKYDRGKGRFIVFDNSSNGTFDANQRLFRKKEYRYKVGSKINLINSNFELTFVLN